MKRRITSLIIAIILLALLVGCVSTQQKLFQSVRQKSHRSVTPAKIEFKEVQKWYWPRHDAVNERLKQGNVDVLFIGNSITNGLDNTGKNVWDEFYASRNAVNMGFGWDWTQHVLWRLDNSDFDNVDPKLAIVLIGTNNSNGDDCTAEEIADGMIAICDRLRTNLPDMKILLMGTFPRGRAPNPQREKITQANLLASRIADGKMIHYLDISERFLDEKTLISREIMPDYLHPNENGYRIWLENIESKVAELLNE
ncbi:GDSL family lipase [candidate division KSB1 bacterium]|nr:GDSL family lipase [candidate division KSB1 bacterium]